jgi:hypothetical protein
MATYFDKQNSICSDSCWEESKKHGNQKINDYQTYSTQLVDCVDPNVRLPEFMSDHVNLRGRPGYGLADACLIDNYSSLVNNKETLTRDRCKLQLFRRLFDACPTMKGSLGDINSELDILSGSDSSFYGSGGENKSFSCKKTIMERQINQPIPLVDCLKDIQNPEHIVPIWTNGGEDTRSYINRLNFNKLN